MRREHDFPHSLNLLERMNELSDGVIRPFNATREGRRGSISQIPAQTTFAPSTRRRETSFPAAPSRSLRLLPVVALLPVS